MVTIICYIILILYLHYDMLYYQLIYSKLYSADNWAWAANRA